MRNAVLRGKEAEGINPHLSIKKRYENVPMRNWLGMLTAQQLKECCQRANVRHVLYETGLCARLPDRI
jgi:hypothetical protein